MNEHQIASDFLKMLTAKAAFIPKVPNFHGTSKGSTLSNDTVDKFDIAEFIKNPLFRTLVLFLISRMASKYEYEKLREFIGRLESTEYAASVRTRREMRDRLAAVAGENGTQDCPNRG